MLDSLIYKIPTVQKVLEDRNILQNLYDEQKRKIEDLKNERDVLDRTSSEKINSLCQEKKKVEYDFANYRETQEKVNDKLKREIDQQQKSNCELEYTVGQQLKTIDELKSTIEQQNLTINRLSMVDQYKRASNLLSSAQYWNQRYINNGNSGSGSYGRLAEFKARTVNDFLDEKGIDTTIEIGCGDGNQLSMIHYKNYVGVDVSPVIIEKNKIKFKDLRNYEFYCSLSERESYIQKKFDLSISMDVIFHLLEDSVFTSYIDDLFSLSNRFVVIYSSNHEEYTPWPEFRHRNFTGYIQQNYPEWNLIRYLPNPYPYKIGEESETSSSDFYFYEKKNQL